MKTDELLIEEIKNLLQSLLSRGMTAEEISIVLVKDVLLPEIEKAKHYRDQLAFTHKFSGYKQ